MRGNISTQITLKNVSSRSILMKECGKLIKKMKYYMSQTNLTNLWHECSVHQ